MRRMFVNITILMLITACTKPIVLKRNAFDKPSINVYGILPERNFYYRHALSDSLEFIGELKAKGSFSNTIPVIFDDYLFVSDLSGRVTAFDLSNMKELGRESYKGEIPVAPVLYRTRLFFVVNEYKDNYSTLYYYDFFTNKYISSFQIPGAVHNEMIFDGDALFIINDYGTLYKFNLIGRKEWEFDTGGMVLSDPAMHDGKITWGNRKGEVLLFDAKLKKVLYKEKISNGFYGGSVIYDGLHLIGGSEGFLYAIDFSTGKVKWKYNTGYKIAAASVTDGMKVYLGNLNGDLHCIDFYNGKRIWSKNYGGLINTAGALFNNVLVQPDLRKKIWFLDPNNGKIIKRIETEKRPRMTPLFFDGKLILGIDKGKLLIYKEAILNL